MIELMQQGNWTLPAILIVSLIGWFAGCVKWLQLRAELDNGGKRMGSPDPAERVREPGAAVCGETFSDRIFAAARDRVRAGRGVDAEQTREIVRLETLRLRQGVPLIGTVAMILPLLGLLGTVLGMMTTFGALSGPGGSPSVTAVSSGISQALITTQAGLVAAVPMLLFHGVLSSRIRRAARRGMAELKHLEARLNCRMPQRGGGDV